jgi:tRNA(Ile2)-agmatinylcytidine synthase
MIIGIDDTDSERGLCTTYLAAVLMERLQGLGELRDLPRLVRLNPCAPFKTRGNAAIALELDTTRPQEVREVALRTVTELSDLSGQNTNPGLVAVDCVSDDMRRFYRRAVTEILEIEEARELLDSEGAWYQSFKKGRGLIGALAAVGAELPDFTFELIAYRERSHWGSPREIEAESVWRADRLTYPLTWDTVDHANHRVVFAPHSGDPILFGIRGDDPSALEQAFSCIRSEPWERRVLYRTNQGTDAHILDGDIGQAKDFQSYRLHGKVSEKPHAIAGGHVFFSLQNGSSSITCAAFEPTKNFRSIIKRLHPGDELDVYGAVRDGTLNLEKVNVLGLAERDAPASPICPQCKRRMESAGKGQGYRCRRCRTRAEGRTRVVLPRDLETGFYEVPPSARRHLAKPLVRQRSQKVHLSR